MKILTQITKKVEQYLITEVGDPIPNKISVIVDLEEGNGDLPISPISEYDLDEMNYFLGLLEVDDTYSKMMVKQIDGLMKSKGYKSKRIISHSVTGYDNGETYLESENYAIELIK